MALPNSVESLINDRTGKFFIVVDWDTGEDRMVRVINPMGTILNVSVVLFSNIDEAQVIPQSDYVKTFSPEQIVTLGRWQQDQFASDEKSRLQRAARSSQQTTSPKAAVARPRTGSLRKAGLIDKSSSSTGRRAKVQWTADTLVFFRHKIDSLSANEVFAVVIEGHGTFQMSKAEFQRKFNNIIMSPEYRTQGLYRYATIPEVALPFIK
jgi:hypothetical protein